MAAGQCDGHGSTHRGPDHSQWFVDPLAQQGLQEGIEMGQDTVRGKAAIDGAGAETKAVKVGNDQPVVRSQQGSEAAELQEGTVEAVEQQQRRTLADHRHRPAFGQSLQLPPLHRPGQIPSLGV